MKYPRIFSISTVGVVMHYNQDYLLHPVRTDFTGRNGIGKSLIADLLQLIFITDTKKIVFGTDSVKKKERQVHTLPYKTNDAYVFLNIEVAEGAFVVIGVNIPNKKGRPLRSFWILNRAHDERDIADLSDLSIPHNKLLTCQDFIKDAVIPPLEQLAINLRDSKQVFLKHFTYKEQKKEFYSFLYDKEILPINLTIEENLNAFAKIIQSFSKAKTLDTDSDKSLKNFLFESSIDSFETQYQEHKASLEKLLNEYKELDQYAELIERKQKYLLGLSKKDSLQSEAYESLLSTQLVQSENSLNRAKQGQSASAKQLELEESTLKKYERTNPKLTRLVKASKEDFDKSEQILTDIIRYQTIYTEIGGLNKSVEELSNIELPELREESSIAVNMEDYDLKEIKRRIAQFTPIYEKYGSIKAIEQKITEQTEKLRVHESELRSEVNHKQGITDLISMNKAGTLFGKLFEDQRVLTKAQETVLLGLLSYAFWDKPKTVNKGTQYVKSLDMLDSELIVRDEDNDGYWFNLGGVYQFVEASDDEQIFASKESLAEAVSNKKDELEIQIKKIRAEINALNQFKRGNPYDSELIELKYELDQELKDFSAANQLKTTAAIIQNLSVKIDQINKGIEKQQEELAELALSIPFEIIKEELDHQVKDCQLKVEVKRKRERKLSELLIKRETKIESFSTSIPNLKSQVSEKEQEMNHLETQFDKYCKEFQKHFSDAMIEDINRSEYTQKSIDQLQTEYTSKREDYVTDYKSVHGLFPETKNDMEIGEQIQNKSYVFSVSETALLGPKIKHLENISDKLKEANRDRISMMGMIHETMLKIFKRTQGKYDEYQDTIRSLNKFFKGKKISEQYYFSIKFKPHKHFSIDWINKLQGTSQRAYKPGEIPFGDTVETFVEEFFRNATGFKRKIKLAELLNPKTYFELETLLTDENNVAKPGSTGESYSAIVLLGIGRLSIVQETKRNGIKFLILEETANLDRENFNTFPNVAEELDYQIITMTPKPYGSDTDQGWYLHHLLRGADDININYPIPNSFYKTNERAVDLKTYLEASRN